jgi:hypothetical protein
MIFFESILFFHYNQSFKVPSSPETFPTLQKSLKALFRFENSSIIFGIKQDYKFSILNLPKIKINESISEVSDPFDNKYNLRDC